MTEIIRVKRLHRLSLIEHLKSSADKILILPETEPRALFHAFHCPFPDVAGDYLKSHGGNMDIHIMREPWRKQERDPLSRLPLELFELVFTCLTAGEIDAARFTWRSKSSHPSIYSLVIALHESGERSRQYLSSNI